MDAVASQAELKQAEDVWPTPLQEDLLRAALLEGNEACEAWRRWRAAIDWQAPFGPGTYRILPLLYARLAEHGIDDPILGRLKGVYRRVWCENRRAFHEGAKALAALHGAGVETLLLKGAPLALRYYQNPAHRPMADVDVAVPVADAARAARILERAGFVPALPITDDAVRFLHSVPFTGPGASAIDLHWRPLFESPVDTDEDPLWVASEPFTFEGLETRAPSPSDLLFQVIVHGMKWNRDPAFRWIADVAAIQRRAGSRVDWCRVVELARRYRTVLRVRSALRYLVDRIGLELPAAPIEALDRIAPTRLERVEAALRLRSRDRVARRRLGTLGLVIADYWRYRAGAPRLAALGRLPHYLYFRWRIRGAPGLPGPLRGAARRARALILGSRVLRPS